MPFEADIPIDRFAYTDGLVKRIGYTKIRILFFRFLLILFLNIGQSNPGKSRVEIEALW